MNKEQIFKPASSSTKIDKKSLTSMTSAKTPTLSQLGDNELLNETSQLVAKERIATAEVLNAINEIEYRRLHLQRGFSSLHECLVKLFKYSDGAAHRRIAAARLLKAVPEVLTAITDGSMNLTNLAAVQDFLVSEKRNFRKNYSKAEKLNLLSSVGSKSKTQCEQVFQNISPERAQTPKPEKVRQVKWCANKANAEFSMNQLAQEFGLEIRITLTPDFQKKLNRLKEIFSHHKQASEGYVALFELMADQLLKKVDPLKKRKAKTNAKMKSQEQTEKASPEKLIEKTAGKTDLDDSDFSLKPTSRYIPSKVRQEAYHRDSAQCGYTDPQSGRRCESKKFLHVDHVTPLALGGTTDKENCRLLCAEHNRLVAIQKLGRRVMQPYLKF